MTVRLTITRIPHLCFRPHVELPGEGRSAGLSPVFWIVLLALAAWFVFFGGANLDLGVAESRLGLAAREGIGPFGQNFGGWEPSLWPGQVIPSQLWARGEGGTPSSASVRWPAAIAGALIGLALAARLARAMGERAGVFLALCWFGSVALVDRSAGASLDLVAGLGVVAALNRIIGKGSDWVAGLWAALALLTGGWPPLALIALATIVIGRPGSGLALKLALPPLAAFAGWSAWALASARAEVWAAALALPLTQPPAFLLALEALALGLPWSPLALLAISPRLRQAWPEPARALVVGWLQVSLACMLAGSLVPGLAHAALLPALAGLAMGAAAVCETLWAQDRSLALPARVRRTFLCAVLALAGTWTVLVVGWGSYLAAAVSYYRPVCLLLIAAALAIGTMALGSTWKSRPRLALLTLVLLAVCLKLAHWGVYVPEWNYRRSQGPWGRAIGQWVPPSWPLYTVHAFPADLAFATERPMRTLADPHLLAYKSNAHPQFVLLHPEEFAHWPADAPRLVLVHSFTDEHGSGRVLARTTGALMQPRLARGQRRGTARN